MTSGSTYVVGWAPPKSRGGVVTVLDGVAGPGGGACAIAARGVKVAAPAMTLMPPMNPCREIGFVSSRLRVSVDMGASTGEGSGGSGGSSAASLAEARYGRFSRRSSSGAEYA